MKKFDGTAPMYNFFNPQANPQICKIANENRAKKEGMADGQISNVIMKNIQMICKSVHYDFISCLPQNSHDIQVLTKVKTAFDSNLMSL
jgi:hypothetical protein